MKKNKLVPIIGFLIIGAVSLMGCSSDFVTAPEGKTNNQSAAQQNGIPTDQLNLVSWNADIVSDLHSLNKTAYQIKLIQAHKGGSVGGKRTFGNKVKIPANALAVNTEISVEVLCIDKNDQCGASVEFLPNISFQLDVTVTLSYDVLNFDGDPNTLKVLWYDDTTGLWVEVEGAVIDEKHKTVSVQVDHFTQYAWSL